MNETEKKHLAIGEELTRVSDDRRRECLDAQDKAPNQAVNRVNASKKCLELIARENELTQQRDELQATLEKEQRSGRTP